MLLVRLASARVEGHVVLGTPYLYAANLLPLVNQVKCGDVDIALVTRMNDFTSGQGQVVIYL